jgi:putative hydrolase of the HAD superfamily
LELNNASAEETLMIGDSFEADIIGAVHAGIDALFLNNTDKKVELPERVREIKSLKEAEEFLR